MLLLYPMFFMQIPYLLIFSGLWGCEEYCLYERLLISPIMSTGKISVYSIKEAVTHEITVAFLFVVKKNVGYRNSFCRPNRYDRRDQSKNLAIQMLPTILVDMVKSACNIPEGSNLKRGNKNFDIIVNIG